VETSTAVGTFGPGDEEQSQLCGDFNASSFPLRLVMLRRLYGWMKYCQNTWFDTEKRRTPPENAYYFD
jgi:hypothetical protein